MLRQESSRLTHVHAADEAKTIATVSSIGASTMLLCENAVTTDEYNRNGRALNARFCELHMYIIDAEVPWKIHRSAEGAKLT